MIKITGYSDDIVLVEGGGCSDELYPNDVSQPYFIACSDGSVLRVIYDDDGIWRITPLYKGSLYDYKSEGSIDEDTFDEVYLKDGVKWIVGGVTMIKAVKETK